MGSPLNTGTGHYFPEKTVCAPVFAETTTFTVANKASYVPQVTITNQASSIPQSTKFSYEKSSSPYVVQEVEQRK